MGAQQFVLPCLANIIHQQVAAVAHKLLVV
jgi:hypothetical protein